MTFLHGMTFPYAFASPTSHSDALGQMDYNLLDVQCR